MDHRSIRICHVRSPGKTLHHGCFFVSSDRRYNTSTSYQIAYVHRMSISMLVAKDQKFGPNPYLIFLGIFENHPLDLPTFAMVQ